MSTESNKAVVRRFIAEVWNAGNFDAADELVHPEYAISGIGTGPDAVRHNVSIYRTAFPDLECVVEQLIAEGDGKAGDYEGVGLLAGRNWQIARDLVPRRRAGLAHSDRRHPGQRPGHPDSFRR